MPANKETPLSETCLQDHWRLLEVLAAAGITTVGQAEALTDDDLDRVPRFLNEDHDALNAGLAALGFPRATDRPIKYGSKVFAGKRQEAIEAEAVQCAAEQMRMRNARKYRHFRLVSCAEETTDSAMVHAYTVRIETSFSSEELQEYLAGDGDSG